jgi:hypothetical protein
MNFAGASEPSDADQEPTWILAREAVQRIMRATNQNANAALGAIIAYAKVGRIKARAIVRTQQWYRQDSGQQRREESLDAVIPKTFWGDFLEGALTKHFDWQSGVFEVRGFDVGDQLRVTLTGVQFDARELDVIDPPPSPSTKSLIPISSETTGRPAKDWWEELLIEISASIYRGDLTPTKQAHIEKAMQNWLTDRGWFAAPSTVRGRASKLWKAMNRDDTTKAKK